LRQKFNLHDNNKWQCAKFFLKMKTIFFLSIAIISNFISFLIIFIPMRKISQKLPLSLGLIVLIPVISYVIIFLNNFGVLFRIGIILGAIVFFLILLNIYSYIFEKKIVFWSVPVGIFLFCNFFLFVFTQQKFLDYIFYISLGTAISLLFSGIYWKLFGLVIPGCLLIGIAPGIFFAWSNITGQNGLVRTGVMLVWFALGWGLVTIFARVQTLKFVWWPLIPGGILAMVGWGLYIGGNPSSAVSFIGNTGSIGLLIFGIYILLIRRGIHH